MNAKLEWFLIWLVITTACFLSGLVGAYTARREANQTIARLTAERDSLKMELLSKQTCQEWIDSLVLAGVNIYTEAKPGFGLSGNSAVQVLPYRVLLYGGPPDTLKQKPMKAVENFPAGLPPDKFPYLYRSNVKEADSVFFFKGNKLSITRREIK